MKHPILLLIMCIASSTPAALAQEYDLSLFKPNAIVISDPAPIAQPDQIMNSAGASGSYGAAPATTTGKQADGTPMTGPVVLSPAQTNLLAPGSSNPSPIHSGAFNYGFPMSGPAPYVGTCGSGFGGILPPTSTSSVDLNTVSP